MNHTWLTETDWAVLDKFFLFRSLSAALVEKTLRDERARGKTYKRAQVIYDPKRFDDSLGLILSGRVEVSQEASDKRLILRFSNPGDVFGAAAVFGRRDAPYVARLTALVGTRVLFFTQDLLRDLMKEDFTAAENYMAFLVSRIQFLNHRIASLAVGGAEAQLLDFLEKEAGDGRRLTIDSSISALSRRLNISRASLYRAFESLEKQGLIEKKGKTVFIYSVQM